MQGHLYIKFLEEELWIKKYVSMYLLNIDKCCQMAPKEVI